MRRVLIACVLGAFCIAASGCGKEEPVTKQEELVKPGRVPMPGQPKKAKP
jgi:hypothetical protein